MTRPPFYVQLTKEQADVMLEALQEKLERTEGDEAKIQLHFAIESILSSGIAHSKER